MHRVLILGAGTAGTIVANKLRESADAADLEITIVDRDDNHHYQPGYLFLPFGSYTPDMVIRSRHHFIPDGVELVLAEIERVDATAKTVTLIDGRALSYDTLIIATGVAPRPDLTPGMTAPGVHHFYDYEPALALADALRDFTGGRLVVHIADMPIKCPVAPLEFAFLADAYFAEKKMRRRVEIVYVTPLDGAFTKPVASRELGDMLRQRKIKLETDFLVERVDAAARELVSFDDRRVPYDLLVTVPLNIGPDYIARSGLGDDNNLVPCDQATMRSMAHPDIFVLGDGGTLQTSKAGSVAHFSIDVFMANWPSYMAGEPLPHAFDGHANCFIESGHGKALLLDFNYETQPYTGSFPLPGVGPLTLLKESRANHLGKLAFRTIYWDFLLRGRPLPFTADMYLAGKRVEGTASGTSTPDLLKGLAVAAGRAPATLLRRRRGRKRPAAPTTVRPTAVTRAAPARPGTRATSAEHATPAYVARPAVDSTADPSTVLPGPIIPTF